MTERTSLGKLVLASSPQGKGRIDLVHRLAVLDGARRASFPTAVIIPTTSRTSSPGIISTRSRRTGGRPPSASASRSAWAGSSKGFSAAGEKVVLRADIKADLSPGEYGVVEGLDPRDESSPTRRSGSSPTSTTRTPGPTTTPAAARPSWSAPAPIQELIRSGALPKPRRTCGSCGFRKSTARTPTSSPTRSASEKPWP